MTFIKKSTQWVFKDVEPGTPTASSTAFVLSEFWGCCYFPLLLNGLSLPFCCPEFSCPHFNQKRGPEPSRGSRTFFVRRDSCIYLQGPSLSCSDNIRDFTLSLPSLRRCATENKVSPFPSIYYFHHFLWGEQLWMTYSSYIERASYHPFVSHELLGTLGQGLPHPRRGPSQCFASVCNNTGCHVYSV